MTTTSESAPPQHALTTSSAPAKVMVVDFDMPFVAMVWLLVKWALASIPAMIILAIIGVVMVGVIAAMTGTHF